tara:strand:- start:14133 stop:15566 length:1434 start_codon:yes stop_codon:yes gene_type:complete
MYQQQKAYPYPQIVTGDSWDVFETTQNQQDADTDNLNKKMYVPLDRHCTLCNVNHSRMIRRKQIAHAKWSPATRGKLKPGTRKEAMDTIESLRIYYLLARQDLGIDKPFMCMDMLEHRIKQMVYQSPGADIILTGIELATMSKDKETIYNRVHLSEQYNLFQKIIESAIENWEDISPFRKTELTICKDIINKFIYKMRTNRAGQSPSYRKTQRMADELSKYLELFMEPPEPYEPPSQGQGNENGDEEGDGTEDSDDANTLESSVKSLENRMRKQLLEQMTYKNGTGIGQWGVMQIHNPPMSVNLQGLLKGSRQYRPMDYGYNPKYINRFCIDRKIFKQKLNVKGGTILIDASGSMSFNSDDILEIMKMLPAVNIAMYNGSYKTGDLRIIAKNGKRVTEKYLDEHSGRGNVIDGPALEWLSTMPARRIWVSDMYVFGAHGDTSGFNLVKECYDLCLKNKIINLKNIDEVKEYALKLNT